MLFNSVEYIFFFLPLVFAGTFFLNRAGHFTAAKIFLILASLFFYAWWNPAYLPIMVSSILVNYFLSLGIQKYKSKLLLGAALVFDVGMLVYYKYADFLIGTANAVLGTQFNFLHLLLPLAISFYTFQAIAYQVDSYKGIAQNKNFIDFALFISFFPQLIAGPIVHHKELMPQFNDSALKKINPQNVARGLALFTIGLAKKVLIADSLSPLVAQGYANTAALSPLEAWLVALAFVFQMYYDFSGYSDMAIGAARLFNIELPINFNSPYRATNLQDFWRRWHITLSRFLRDYIYIPLGGNRKGFLRQLSNAFWVFFIGGLWHGAGWLFAIWGAMHGIGMALHSIWKKLGFTLHPYIGWFITMLFWTVSMVFFRAPTLLDAKNVLVKMVDISAWVWPVLHKRDLVFNTQLWDNGLLLVILMGAALVAALWRNSNEIVERLSFNRWTAVAFALLLLGVVGNLTKISEFLYFQF